MFAQIGAASPVAWMHASSRVIFGALVEPAL
jgi:hypothetical protein